MKLSKRIAKINLELRIGAKVQCRPTPERLATVYRGWPEIRDWIREERVFTVRRVLTHEVYVEENGCYWPRPDLEVIG